MKISEKGNEPDSGSERSKPLAVKRKVFRSRHYDSVRAEKSRLEKLKKKKEKSKNKKDKARLNKKELEKPAGENIAEPKKVKITKLSNVAQLAAQKQNLMIENLFKSSTPITSARTLPNVSLGLSPVRGSPRDQLGMKGSSSLENNGKDDSDRESDKDKDSDKESDKDEDSAKDKDSDKDIDDRDKAITREENGEKPEERVVEQESSDDDEESNSSTSSDSDSSDKGPKKKKAKLLENEEYLTHLRVKEDDEDAVELVPNSGIFVNEILLHGVTSKKTKTHTGIARSLIQLVFKPEAAAKCSLLGGMQKGPLGATDVSRPALYPKGLDAIKSFAYKYCKDNRIKRVDEAYLHKQMNTMLSEIRARVAEDKANREKRALKKAEREAKRAKRERKRKRERQAAQGEIE